jgi:electron transfer flavoprotein alpha subunit
VRVLTLVEHDVAGPTDGSLRALSFARMLGCAEPVAVLFGEVAAETMPALGQYGVKDAYVVKGGGLQGFAPLGWARALAGLAGLSRPESGEGLGQVGAVIAPGSDHGNEVLAHLGAVASLPMVANCFGVIEDGGGGGDGGSSLRLSRQRWGGSLIEEAVLEVAPAILTVATDAVAPVPVPPEGGWAAGPVVHEHTPELSPADLGVEAEESREHAGGVSLASAKVVVSGGRGVGGPEGFSALEQLAELLGGAVGVSRVVTSLGWRPHTEQVGQTGTRVAPDLYLACGISGAIQHLAGCQSARHMVAINTDPDAPIMSRADYAVIGDVNAVLPALVAALRSRRASS